MHCLKLHYRLYTAR